MTFPAVEAGRRACVAPAGVGCYCHHVCRWMRAAAVVAALSVMPGFAEAVHDAAELLGAAPAAHPCCFSSPARPDDDGSRSPRDCPEGCGHGCSGPFHACSCCPRLAFAQAPALDGAGSSPAEVVGAEPVISGAPLHAHALGVFRPPRV